LNGIDVDAFGHISISEARRKLGIETQDILIGSAGRLGPKKGFGDLIQAFADIHKSHPNTRLVVIGEGSSRGGLERQARKTGVGDRIHFTGFRNDIPELLGALDILVQPSISEGLSISLLEGMAAGKTLVACDIQGNREVIFDGLNGVLVAPSNPRALAAAIRTLLDNPTRARELGLAAQVDCRKRFSHARMVKEILGLYDSVVSGKRATDSGLRGDQQARLSLVHKIGHQSD
jgi:glycosyltransferase involved in cell wall biosynthesis